MVLVMSMQFFYGSHSLFSLHYHLVLVTKYRHPCITEEMAGRMDAVIADYIKNQRGEA